MGQNWKDRNYGQSRDGRQWMTRVFWRACQLMDSDKALSADAAYHRAAELVAHEDHPNLELVP